VLPIGLVMPGSRWPHHCLRIQKGFNDLGDSHCVYTYMLRPETTSFVNLVHNIPSAFSTSRQEGKVLETAIVANTITAHTFCCRKEQF